jgi:SAM-dependent methyltransferase
MTRTPGLRGRAFSLVMLAPPALQHASDSTALAGTDTLPPTPVEVAHAMMLEPSRTFRRARLTTIALATAAFITLSDSALAQRADRPPLDVPYVPTPPEVVERMLEMATVRRDDFVIDLGSGDGRIAIAAARKGARALGIDIDPERVLEAQDNAKKAGVQDRVHFKRQDLFDAEFSDATVVTMYLLTKINLDLRPRILGLKPGTRVVSHSFDMGDWKPDIHSEIGHRQVFMWIVPAKAAGRWAGLLGAASLSLDLQQEYQYLTGSAEIASKTVAVREGWLHGSEMHLTLSDGRKLRGRIDGERMGSLPVDARDKPAVSWHAIRQS